jgi:hypothetical protein
MHSYCFHFEEQRMVGEWEVKTPDYSSDFFIRETGITWIILRTTFQLRLIFG